MTVRLYMDEDSMDTHLVRALRARHVAVVTSEEAGMRERTDEEQLAYASAQGRVLYSFNVGHFSRLHNDYLSRGKTHAG
jgi:predicted nuclease of predicted toxin-antitoxin system